MAKFIGVVLGVAVWAGGLSGPAQQTAGVLPVYDAAVIRLNKTITRGTDIDVDDATFQAKNITLKKLISNAYGIHEDLIAGLPGWAESSRWDINAKVVDPDLKVLSNLPREQREAMLAALVGERFRLKVHVELKTLPVYELIVGKDGSKLKQSAIPPPDQADPRDGGTGSMSVRNTDMTATGTKMSELAQSLSYRLDRTVIDKTGLTGKYDFRLQWSPDSVANAAADSGQGDAPPPIFTAIQEQLGLKLQAAKGPVKTLVVDHVEEPTEN